jgi:ABC-type amino acid transport substrate-binding protein
MEVWMHLAHDFDPAEADAILLAIVKGAGAEGVTEDNRAEIFEQLQNYRLDAVLLDGVLDGRFALVLKDGELVFSLTEQGRALAAQAAKASSTTNQED